MNIQKGIVKDINHFAQSDLFDRIRKDYPKHDLWWEKALYRDCWFSVVEEEIIAACIVKIEGSENCDFSTEEIKILKISLFIISDKYKRHGLGRTLLEKVEDFAIENGINDIYVSTKSTNEEAINFFIKNNFQIVQISNNEIYLQKRGLYNYIEINRKAYDSLSHEYKIRGDIKSGYEETPTYLAGNILNLLPQNAVFTVLEVGPGSGEIIEEFENKGHRTIAVELSSRIAYYAKEKSPKSIFINSNILDITFLNEQFDIIYAGALIHLFNEIDAHNVLNKFNQWLKRTGVMFINTTISEVTEEGFYYKNDYNSKVKRFRRKWRENDFKCFIEKYFQIEKTLYTNEIDRQKVWVGFICKKY
jgi:ribosomal protein S18 acetylase RimI-like enzyme/ubiquinone/menaquinone biosynthesis C-methylase UbiE